MTTDFLVEVVEDTVVSMAEFGARLPSYIPVRYTEAEWELVERLHRLSVTTTEKFGSTVKFSDDRYPFVEVKVLGIRVRLYPDKPAKQKETIH